MQKILATSDLHGLITELAETCQRKKPDILIIAGDIHPASISCYAPEWFEKVFFPLVAKLPCEVVATPGNHDFWLAGNYDKIKNGNFLYVPKNFHLLVDEEIEINGLRIYGTPWVPYINGRWCYEKNDRDLKEYFDLIPKGLDILISHSPPLISGKMIDVSCDNPKEWQRHFGSIALANAIRESKPRAVFCGHIHSGAHGRTPFATGSSSKTFLWNVSRVNEQYRVAYPMTAVAIGEKGAPKEI